jgi:hypothetical protein
MSVRIQVFDPSNAEMKTSRRITGESDGDEGTCSCVELLQCNNDNQNISCGQVG